MDLPDILCGLEFGGLPTYPTETDILKNGEETFRLLYEMVVSILNDKEAEKRVREGDGDLSQTSSPVSSTLISIQLAGLPGPRRQENGKPWLADDTHSRETRRNERDFENGWLTSWAEKPS